MWILPYIANNAVAYAAVEKVQADLVQLDLVPPDEVRYWESTMGEINPAAKRRFDEVSLVQATVKELTPSLKKGDGTRRGGAER